MSDRELADIEERYAWNGPARKDMEANVCADEWRIDAVASVVPWLLDEVKRLRAMLGRGPSDG